MRTLMWFRNDLRTVDNTALAEAARAGEVVGVFLMARKQWEEHAWGDNKIDFVLRNVAALRRKLTKLNVPLRFVEAPRFAEAAKSLLKIAAEHRCDGLAYNMEYEVNERRRDAAVEAAFAQRGLRVRGHHDQTIVPPGALRTGAGRFYSVFTPYRKAWLAQVRDGESIETNGGPRRQADLGIGSEDVPAGEALADRWPGGEDEAMRRLEAFVERRIDDYHAQRDRPAVDRTSALSPYLACGAISPRQCWSAATGRSGGKLDRRRSGPAAWLGEIVWREFYRHVLFGCERVSMNQPFKLETKRLAWRDSGADLDAWKRGQTGVPIVDAGMRQLREIGWMHNRLRMIVAMYLTKNLLIHWRGGERHFMQHLVDGDLASNNGGWQWSASTGTDAAPYFRVFNPVSQSKKFDADGAFIRRYVDELRHVEAPEIHDPSPETRRRVGYTEMLVDLKSSRQRAIDAFKNLRG